MPEDPAADAPDAPGEARADVTGDVTDGGGPSLAAKVLDVLVFAPAGAVLSTLEDVPAMAGRGRSLLEQEVRNAHLVGQFAVGEGQRRLQRGLERLRRPDDARPAPAPQPPATADDEVLSFEPRTPAPAEAAPAPAEPAPAAEPGPATTIDAGRPAAPVQRPPGRAVTAEANLPATGTGSVPDEVTADLAIPGYDTLSASQVVRRLDGLSPGELAAVFRHESATRGRRTILHRAQQLLGPGGATSPDRA